MFNVPTIYPILYDTDTLQLAQCLYTVTWNLVQHIEDFSGCRVHSLLLPSLFIIHINDAGINDLVCKASRTVVRDGVGLSTADNLRWRGSPAEGLRASFSLAFRIERIIVCAGRQLVHRASCTWLLSYATPMIPRPLAQTATGSKNTLMLRQLLLAKFVS